MIYYRIDPARSAATNLWVMDSDANLSSLMARNPDCSVGGHNTFVSPVHITNQNVTCIDSGTPLFTMIYQA